MATYARNIKESNESGIYCIRNKINNKRYIGQSDNLNNRWKRHKSDLKCGTHFNRHLQSAYDKYGLDNFEFIILEKCSIELLDEREVFWIDYYDSKNNGYNLAEGGLGCRGYKHSEEEIIKMRMIQNPKSVVQLDLSGKYIATFISCGEAASSLGKESCSGIKRCCEKDKYKKAYGYIWVYKEDYNNNNIDWNYYLNGMNVYQPVIQCDLSLKIIKEWENAASTSIDGFSPSTVSSACNGKYNTYMGYIWYWKYKPYLYFDNKEKRQQEALKRKLSKQKDICQYNQTTNELLNIYTNQQIKELGYNLKSVQSCCNGHTQSYKGYKWEYAN